VTGYKITEPDKYKGQLFSCRFDPVDGDPAQFTVINLPYPYNNPHEQAQTPYLTISYDEIAEVFAVTGGNGMILFSSDGINWWEPTNRPYEDDESAWYRGYFTRFDDEFRFTVIDDNYGIAWTSDFGENWTTQSFGQDYEIYEYGSYEGKLVPLSLPNSYYDCTNRMAVGLSMGYYTILQNNGFYNDPPYSAGANSEWWWWHGATGTEINLPGGIKRNWFCGSDGIIGRHDWPNFRYERDPENNLYYKMTGIGGYYGEGTRKNWADGTKDGIFLKSNQYTGGASSVSPPTAQTPEPPLYFGEFYDPIFEGYHLYWEPPGNYAEAKVGGYWICPTDEEGRWGIFNDTPLPRLTYFIKGSLGSWQDGRVAAMSRNGVCGPWSDWAWLCAIDKMVDAEATGKNNARRLVYGGNTHWAFWQKNNEIYVASSADSGKHWTYRSSAPPSLGNGQWPAAGIDNNNNPAVCWIENVVNGSQVTARIYYRRYNAGDWESSHILKEETFTGTGYLYPSVSVDEDNHVHIVYGKLYNGDQDWQVWYGEFPLNDPLNVDWYLLDYQPGEPEATNKLLPAIGTDKYSKPMVVWNRPNSSTFYFAYRDDEDEWHTKILDFTGTTPCLEVVGTTAYLTYVNSGDIWYSVGGTGGFGTPDRISNTLGASSAPVIANNIIVWEEHVDNDYEIYYSYLQDDLKWTAPEKLFGYAYFPDRMPQIVWVYPFAFVAWTQAESNRVVCFSREEIKSDRGDGPASMAYDLGDETQSPILVQRTGYVEYGQEPGMIVDIGSDVLEYHFVGLDNEYSWKGRLLFYHQSNQSISCRLKFNNQPILISIPPNYILEKTYDIPEALIINEELNFTIEPISNSSVVISGILLYSRPKHGSGGGPQSQNEQIISTLLNLKCQPVIFNKATEISYSLGSETETQLSVYNSVGQLVVVIDKGRRNGNQVIVWSPKDRYGEKLANGIYFLQLKTPVASEVKKMVILE